MILRRATVSWVFDSLSYSPIASSSLSLASRAEARPSTSQRRGRIAFCRTAESFQLFVRIAKPFVTQAEVDVCLASQIWETGE